MSPISELKNMILRHFVHLKAADNVDMLLSPYLMLESPESERAKGGASILVRQGSSTVRFPLNPNFKRLL